MITIEVLREGSKDNNDVAVRLVLRAMRQKQDLEQVPRYADMLSAMEAEARLRIMQLLLSAHPDGLIVGQIGEELEIPKG